VISLPLGALTATQPQTAATHRVSFHRADSLREKAEELPPLFGLEQFHLLAEVFSSF
jgi:hypothetical protein